MADTIISNVPRSVDDSGSAGWIVALVIVLAAIIGGVALYQNGFLGTPTPTTANINVTVPAPTAPAPVTVPTTE
jgi:hypothetical protein